MTAMTAIEAGAPGRRGTARGRDALAGLAVQVHATLESAEPTWRSLEATGVLSPYQRYDWAVAWLDRIGALSGVQPLVFTVSSAEGRPLALLPLARRRLGPVSVALWLGGKHCNYGLGVYDPAFAEGASPETIRAILREGARTAGIDLFVLLNQPEGWSGARNPFLGLDRTPSASTGWALPLEPDFEALLLRARGASFKKHRRRREKRLAAGGALAFERVDTPEAARAAIETFLAQKADRFAQIGKSNDFDEPGAAEFARAIGEIAGRPGSSVEIYELRSGDEVVAMACGGTANGRFSCFFNSITTGPLAQFSPSEVLISRILQTLCERGFGTFDLGVGDSPYKMRWCAREPLFDCFLGVTPAGRIAALGYRQLYGIKRRIKENEAMLKAVQRLRARLSGAGSAEAPAPDRERDGQGG